MPRQRIALELSSRDTVAGMILPNLGQKSGSVGKRLIKGCFASGAPF